MNWGTEWMSRFLSSELRYKIFIKGKIKIPQPYTGYVFPVFLFNIISGNNLTTVTYIILNPIILLMLSNISRFKLPLVLILQTLDPRYEKISR